MGLKCAWCRKEIFTKEYNDSGEFYCKECFDKWEEAVKRADILMKEWNDYWKEHENEIKYWREK